MGVIPGARGAQAGDLDPAAVPKSTVTTADDLIVATGSAAVTRLGVGASRIVGKKATGGLAALTPAELGTILAGVVALVPGSPLTFTQTGSTTLTTVAADVNVGVLTLLTDAITAIGVLQTAVNDNRHLINALIDALQAAGIAL